VHRVFPSSHIISASAQTVQFHWNHVGDSGKVVTPFMHVGTYPTRNFATLGPSELQPPFARALSHCFHKSFSLSSTGQVSDPIHHFTILQSLVFLVNSRPPLFSNTSKKNNNLFFYRHSFFRSYRAFLPSSFNTIISSAFVFSTSLLVSVLVRFF
jgi:hypothetical protein